jgi:hypothetical protein
MSMKAEPQTFSMVVKPQFVFGILVESCDHPAHMRKIENSVQLANICTWIEGGRA